MLNDGPEGGDDAAKESGNVAGADEKIVDFEKDLEAVAFTSELVLVGLGSFEVEGVIHGDGDLRGDALHEFDFSVADALGYVAAETDGTEAMLRGGERNDGEGKDAVFPEAPHGIRVARLLGGVESDERLLILPDPAGGGIVDREIGEGRGFVRFVSFEDVQSHSVSGRVVENEGEKIELQNGVEALGELMEKAFEVALLGDGFADFEKRFELAAGVLETGGRLGERWNFLRVVHEKQNSTGNGAVKTGGGCGRDWVWVKFSGAARRD